MKQPLRSQINQITNEKVNVYNCNVSFSVDSSNKSWLPCFGERHINQTRMGRMGIPKGRFNLVKSVWFKVRKSVWFKVGKIIGFKMENGGV